MQSLDGDLQPQVQVLQQELQSKNQVRDYPILQSWFIIVSSIFRRMLNYSNSCRLFTRLVVYGLCIA